MKTSRRQICLAVALLATTVLCSAMAQAYPSELITFIVGYPVGGDTDAMTRLFADKLSQRLGQPVVVQNRPAASGTIGTVHVAKAAPDGYTLLLATSTFSIAQFVLKTSVASCYDVLGGFVPVVQASVQQLFVATSQASGIKDLIGLTLAAQARKSELTYASTGGGSPIHVFGEMFSKAAGFKLAHVHYKGVAPAVNDLSGGHVSATFTTWGAIAPYAGTKANVLAEADAQRSLLVPNMPTLTELGVKNAEVTTWQGLVGPQGMCPETVKLLSTHHLNETLKMPEVATKMATFGALPAGCDARPGSRKPMRPTMTV